MANNVTQPVHYSGAGLECIDVIEAMLGPEGFRAFCLGNVLKYSWRHRQKNGPEDLAKAKVYRAWAEAGTASGRDCQKPSYEEEAVRHAAPPLASIDLETDPKLLARLERAEVDSPHVAGLKTEEAFGGACE